jgi:phosphatidylinositol glycan class T
MRSSFHLLAVLAAFVVACRGATDYHERLTLQPLPTSSLLASFNFRSNSTVSAFDNQHFRYFPRSLGQILQHTNTKELHVRFTTGRWDDESWGARPSEGYKEGATGVELWAWIDSGSQDECVTFY